MKINIEKQIGVTDYFNVGNILTLKRKEAEHDKNIQDIITVIVSEDRDGNIVFINEDYTFYSEYYEEFTSDHTVIECINVYGDSYRGYADKILDGCLIIANDECDDETHYFLCSSNENDFYLMDINNSYTYDAKSEFNIHVADRNDDMYILEKIFENQGFELVEIIEADKLELKRIEEVKEVKKTNDLVLDIISAYEDLASVDSADELYFCNNYNMDLSVVYANDGEYHCHLDIVWDKVEDDTRNKLFVRIYAIQGGDIIGTKDIKISNLVRMNDEQLEECMINFLQECI